jgi:hypothetical protein
MAVLLVSLFQQLEAIQRVILPTQNGILAIMKVAAQLTKDQEKAQAEGILTEQRKADQALRDRLFVLQVWRRYDQETADKFARRKAGEYLDEDLAKCLEERDKRCVKNL